VQAIVERCGFEPGMSFAMVQPLAFDSSQTTIFPALAHGGCLHVIAEETAADPGRLEACFARAPVDVLKIAPSHLAALQASPRWAQILPHRCLVIGGEASRRDWAQELAATAPCAIFNHYGPTETTVGVLTYRVDGDAGAAGSAALPIGRPLPNVRAYVLDAARQPVPIGVPGELCIGGDCVARGYLNRPELTADAFVPDPFAATPGARLYRTGDLARWQADGNIEFLGRRDDQVKIRGFRVEIGEVEAALRRHPGVRDCVVIAREDAAQARRLVAYVVPGLDPVPAAADLREHLHRALPAPMVPSQVVLLDALPLTAHGKLDRRALPVPGTGGGAGGAPLAVPRTPLERSLATLWAELLQCERIGVHDDFFDLGGHSLLAMQLVGRIREAFAVELPMRQLFDAPTIAGLAAAIAGARAAPDRSAADRRRADTSGCAQ
jgi:acyl-coenzyme A synthetase/AMP-(fatty) acid ligase/acyl carrier protein